MRAKRDKEIRERIATLYFQRKFNRLVRKKARNEAELKKAIENGERIENEIRALKKSHAHYIKMFKKINGKGSSARHNYVMFGEVAS